MKHQIRVHSIDRTRWFLAFHKQDSCYSTEIMSAIRHDAFMVGQKTKCTRWQLVRDYFCTYQFLLHCLLLFVFRLLLQIGDWKMTTHWKTSTLSAYGGNITRQLNRISQGSKQQQKNGEMKWTRIGVAVSLSTIECFGCASLNFYFVPVLALLCSFLLLFLLCSVCFGMQGKEKRQLDVPLCNHVLPNESNEAHWITKRTNIVPEW